MNDAQNLGILTLKEILQMDHFIQMLCFRDEAGVEEEMGITLLPSVPHLSHLLVLSPTSVLVC